MATSPETIAFVCDCLAPYGDVRSKKMFGEYLVYLNDRPILTVCDNLVYVKQLPQLDALMQDAPRGEPPRDNRPPHPPPSGGNAPPPRPPQGDAPPPPPISQEASQFFSRILDKLPLKGVDTADILLLLILFFLFEEKADDELLVALGLLLIL
mgnify:CR=1 FL=1